MVQMVLWFLKFPYLKNKYLFLWVWFQLFLSPCPSCRIPALAYRSFYTLPAMRGVAAKFLTVGIFYVPGQGLRVRRRMGRGKD